MSIGGEQLQPLTRKKPFSTRESSSYIIMSAVFKLLISNFFPFFSLTLFILLSFPRRTFRHSSRLQNPPSHLLSLLRGGGGHCFALTKTLLLSGNYRQRLITTLGSNDAAPNEIFIKDPSASN